MKTSQAVATTKDGKFQAFNEAGMYRVYLVSNDPEFGAVGMIHFMNLDDFAAAVAECEEEIRCLMEMGA